ncbi:MAG: hypothetical protein JW908_12490 [Anaerolineales bacterium]|nr:hypothetical protein [Anaerolineales bacterium]
MTTNPVQTIPHQYVSLDGGMLRSLRRLCLEMASCTTGSQNNDCTTRSELNAQIETAISEIAAEWGFYRGEACLAPTESDETQNNR